MRALFTLLFVLLVPVAAACGNATSSDGSSGSTRGVPRSAISTETLDTTWQFSLRDVTQQSPTVSAIARSMVTDGGLEFYTDDGASVVFAVENFDPRAAYCHPNGVILDDACADRSTYPYVIFESSPVNEIFLNGRACYAPAAGSAMEMTADDAHRLHRVRGIAPVVCTGGDARTYEITIVRAESADAFGSTSSGKPPVSQEPIIIGDQR